MGKKTIKYSSLGGAVASACVTTGKSFVELTVAEIAVKLVTVVTSTDVSVELSNETNVAVVPAGASVEKMSKMIVDL